MGQAWHGMLPAFALAFAALAMRWLRWLGLAFAPAFLLMWVMQDVLNACVKVRGHVADGALMTISMVPGLMKKVAQHGHNTRFMLG